MTEQPTNQQTAKAYGLGLLAGVGFALLYSVGAEVVGLNWGLIVVALFGGWVIGGAVSYGAWAGQQHRRVRRLQTAALVIGCGSWLLALVLGYLISQALIPQAATPLLDRLSPSGFIDYFGGLFDYVRLIHLLGLALLTFMAWRSAR